MSEFLAIPDRPRNQYGDEMCITEICITEICMELHLAEPDADRRAELVGFLEYKLVSWQWPHGRPFPNQFDDAVRSLIIAALIESAGRA